MAKPHMTRVSPPDIYEAERIHTLYRALPLPESRILSIHQYFEAASHLYGILPLKHLLHIYNTQNPPVSTEDFLSVAEVIRHEANDFYILEPAALYADAPVTDPMEHEIVSLAVLAFGTEQYYELTQQQVGKPYPILPKEELLAYLDPRFFPSTPQNLNMLAFLRSRLPRLRQSARNTLRTIQTMIWVGCGIQDVSRGLASEGFHFLNHAEQREFAVLFHAMERHTRTIANRGQSSAAMGKHRNPLFIAQRRVFARL